MRYFLQSERIGLRPLETLDASSISKWHKNSRIIVALAETLPSHPMEIDQTIRHWAYLNEHVVFAIDTMNDYDFVGYVGVHDIHFAYRQTEIRGMIGETALWNQGLGTEVLELISRYCFDELNMHRLQTAILAENGQARRMFEKAGFEKEATHRKEIFRNNGYLDCETLGLIEHRYRDRKGES